MSDRRTFLGGTRLGGNSLRGFAFSGADAIGREAGLLALQTLIKRVTNPEGLSQYEQVIRNCIYKPRLDVCVDVAGLDQVIIDLERKALGPLLFPEKYVGYSKLLAAPKGILLHGPPGTGKTMLAKMIANNSGLALINISSSALVSKWYGESEKTIDALFSMARRLEPCIIFIDEIDSILGKRSGNEPSHVTSFKAEFLLKWDGITSSSAAGSHQRVLVMGSTNRKSAIDEAFLRRMPFQISVGLPNHAQRVQLLKHFLRDTPGGDTLDLVKLARHMDGFSGSVIEDCCKDACLQPVNEAMYHSSATVPGDPSPRPLAFADFFTSGVLHHAHRVPSNAMKSWLPGSRITQGSYVLYTTMAILFAWLAGPRLFQLMASMHSTSRLSTAAIWSSHQLIVLVRQLCCASAKLITWAKTLGLFNTTITSGFAPSSDDTAPPSKIFMLCSFLGTGFKLLVLGISGIAISAAFLFSVLIEKPFILRSRDSVNIERFIAFLCWGFCLRMLRQTFSGGTSIFVALTVIASFCFLLLLLLAGVVSMLIWIVKGIENLSNDCRVSGGYYDRLSTAFRRIKV